MKPRVPVPADPTTIRDLELKAQRLSKIVDLMQSPHASTVLMLLDEQKHHVISEFVKPLDLTNEAAVLSMPYTMRGKLMAIESIRLNLTDAQRNLSEVHDALKSIKEED